MRSISLALGLVAIWCVYAWAAPISLDINKNINLALGTKAFGPFDIPDDLVSCRISIDRTNWTNANAKLSARLSISVDGGPFLLWRGIDSAGSGPLTGRFGTPITATFIEGDLPTGLNRRIQGTYVVSGARFLSTITVACS